MSQEFGSDRNIIPDNHNILTVAVCGGLRVVETAGLDMFSIDNDVFVMMDLVGGNHTELSLIHI